MCGIAGIVGPGAARHRHLVEQMLATMRHRGPDGDGIWSNDDAVLGCARLAVVDPARGAQPIRSDPSVVVVGNGEIYGHRRAVTADERAAFGSDSDMEVVAPLWRRHGEQLPTHLPGTFALAVYDVAASSLLLARDAFGERPLYWAAFADGLLAFASEPAALLDCGIVRREVDPIVLADMVRLGYVPPGACIWSGMQSLRPGHRLTVRRDRPEPSIVRWWSPPQRRVQPSLDEAAIWLRGALDAAVEEQLEADVPVGLFLSGGLDSSTVAALAAHRQPGIPAFAFDMPVDSEHSWAARVAERHGLALRTCRADEGALADDLLAASRAWSEPIGDSSTLVTWLLARLASDEVKVVLTGDGADELLGGYACWSRPALAAVEAPGGRRNTRWWHRRSPRQGSAVARAYRGARSTFDVEALVSLGLAPSKPEDLDVSAYSFGDVEDICRFDIDWYLPGDILVKTDRASMAHSIEVRAPFLDRTVAEGCLALGPDLKIDAHQEKLVLRRAFAASWPEGLADRPKQGFGAPMDRWLALPAVADLTHELLGRSSAPVFDLLDHRGVAAQLAAGGQGAWTLLMVALWWHHHGASVPA